VTWFETLTGCREESPDYVRENLSVEGNVLRSAANCRDWCCGDLETPTLAELRERVKNISRISVTTEVREVVADIQQLHCDTSNTGAMFQVASQFNLLEMTSPNVTPEAGVGIYEQDFTQGPACAIAAGAGTIYRNYFAPVNGHIGQTAENQIDCLSDMGKRLGNSNQRLWEMKNGYALPSQIGLETVNRQLEDLDKTELDELRGLLRIGIHSGTQVTMGDSSHVVSQAYCSAMPVSYSPHSSELWAAFAKIVLEAAYEATICAAIENAQRTGNNDLYLTLLGGGAFGNALNWITDSIRRAVCQYNDCGLSIAIVSYGTSKPAIEQLTHTLNQ